ncbi:hypothetical protein ACQP3J_32610, partial [Escherichia coli]
RNVTTILLSEDSSSSAGSVDIATWAMIPAQEKHKKVNVGNPPCPILHTPQRFISAHITYSFISAQTLFL